MKDFLDILDENRGSLVAITLQSGEQFTAIPKGWREVDDGLAYSVRVEKGTAQHVAGMGYVFRNKRIAAVTPIQKTLTA